MRQGSVRGRWRALAAAATTAVLLAATPASGHAEPADGADTIAGAAVEIVTPSHHPGSPLTVELKGFLVADGTSGQKVTLKVTSTEGYDGPAALCITTDALGNGGGTVDLPVGLPLGTYTLNALAGNACGEGVEAPERAIETPFEVTAHTLLATSFATVTGKAKVGKVVKTTSPHWSGTPDAVNVQWHRNGHAIPGATKTRYRVVAKDLGKRLSVTHTARLGDALSETTSADTAKVVRGTLKAKKKPRIKGAAKVGKKLRATRGTWSPRTVKVKYQWFRDGKAVKKATRSTYKVKRADRGSKIQVRVSAKKAGYKWLKKKSVARKVR